MAAKGLSVSIYSEGIKGTLNAFRKLPKEASENLRDGSLKLSKTLANRVKAAGLADSDQAAAVAPTVKAVRDRVPAITAGGPTPVASTRVPAWKILFGSEFGARRRFGWYAARKYSRSTGRQYRPHLGKGSYWMFKAVEEGTATINTAWAKVANDIVKSFTSGGD